MKNLCCCLVAALAGDMGRGVIGIGIEQRAVSFCVLVYAAALSCRFLLVLLFPLLLAIIALYALEK